MFQRLHNLKVLLTTFITGKQEHLASVERVTFGIPVRALRDNTGGETDGHDVYAISEQELLKFLDDNGFKRHPEPWK